MNGWVWYILTIIGLVLLGGFFTAASTALVSVRRSRIRELADERNRKARRILRLLEDPTSVTAASAMAAMLCWLLAAAVSAVGPVQWLSALLSRAPYQFIVQQSLAISMVLVTLLVTILLISIGELFFKSLAAHNAERFALALIGPAVVVGSLLRPLVRLVSGLSNLLLLPFGTRARLTWPALTEEELMVLVEAGQEEGVIEEDERDMIDSILEFTDTVVRQVMVPRIDMQVVSQETSLREVVEGVMAEGHSRIPVYENTVDNVIGIVHAKDLLGAISSGAADSMSLPELMRPAFFIPENKRISELLAEFRMNNQQMAIVRDEYGGTAGLVTVEDLIEEIVGEIRDEYDKEEPLILVQDDSCYLVDARTNIDDLNEQIDSDFPEDEYETIGGLIFGLLGKDPEVGDSVDYEDWRLKVQEKEERRLRKILLEPIAPDQNGASSGDSEASDSVEKNLRQAIKTQSSNHSASG